MKNNIQKVLSILEDGLKREKKVWEDSDRTDIYQEARILGVELAISWIENNYSNP